jgi:methionyl-tRNA formyltransferase
MEVAFSPVKESALRLGVPITQPEKIKNNQEFRAQLEAAKPDAIIVVGYGRIVPQWMLELPRFGNINLHASLLPKYRGAAPIQWAIAEGETVTGVTTMKIDAGLDTGDILLQQEMTIAAEDTAVSLSPRLATMGAELMIKTLRGLERSEVTSRPQDSSKATLAPILRKEHGRIDFECSARVIWNRLRGFQPWPGAHTSFRERGFVVHGAHPAEDSRSLEPGELAVDGTRLLAGCGQRSTLELTEVQLEGKRRMSAADFINGYRPKPRETLGS